MIQPVTTAPSLAVRLMHLIAIYCTDSSAGKYKESVTMLSV